MCTISKVRRSLSYTVFFFFSPPSPSAAPVTSRFASPASRSKVSIIVLALQVTHPKISVYQLSFNDLLGWDSGSLLDPPLQRGLPSPPRHPSPSTSSSTLRWHNARWRIDAARFQPFSNSTFEELQRQALIYFYHLYLYERSWCLYLST